ncbi:MAG: WD40 repeat domain-containing serine/threonine protein kinase [Isosphaeraceae bacterium]
MVWKARDPKLDRAVALKLPRAGNVGLASEKERFLREARAAAQLRHPGIVPVHEVGEHDGQAYLVSELVVGENLAEWLTSKSPTFRQAAGWVAAVADALDHAHQQGVTHRDIKPSNVLLDASGEPHVTDFGLAKRAAGEATITADGHLLGTPAFMAPEQIERPHAVDGRADVYALGVMLYQLLTGELPFRGTQRMVLKQVQEDEPRPPRKLNDRIPKDLETVCLKAMAKEPRERYATARDLAEDLGRWLEGRCVLARPTPRIQKIWRWCLRNRAVATLTALSALAVLGMLAASILYALAQNSARQRETILKNQAERFRDDTRVTASRLSLERGIELAGRGDPARALLYFADALERLPHGANSMPEVEYATRVAIRETSRQIHKLECVLKSADRPGDSLALDSRFERRSVPAGIRAFYAGSFAEGHITSFAWHPKGEHRIVTATIEGAVQAWNAEDGSPTGSPSRSAGILPSVRFNANGTRLIVTSLTSHDQVTNRREKAIEILEWPSCKRLGQPIRLTDAFRSNAPEDRVVVSELYVMSPAGDCFLVWTSEGLRLVHLGSGAQTELKSGDGFVNRRIPERCWVQFSPDGSLLLVGGKGVDDSKQYLRVYQYSTGNLIASVELPGAGDVLHASFHPSNGTITYIGQDGLRLFKSPGLEPLSDTLAMDVGRYDARVDYLADNQLAVSVLGKLVAMLRVNADHRFELVTTIREFVSSGRTSDGKALVGTSSFGEPVIYDVGQSKIYGIEGVVKVGHQNLGPGYKMLGPRHLLSFNRDRRTELRLFHLVTLPYEVAPVYDTPPGGNSHPMLSARQLGQPISCTAYGTICDYDEGTGLMAVTRDSGHLQIYRINQGGPEAFVRSVAEVALGDDAVYQFSPPDTAERPQFRELTGQLHQGGENSLPRLDSKTLVDLSAAGERDNRELLSVNSDGSRRLLTVYDQYGWVDQLARGPSEFTSVYRADRKLWLAPDGKRLVRRDSAGKLHVHDALPPFTVQKVLSHPRYVIDCTFTPDSLRLLSVCEDGRLRTWDVAQGRLAGAPTLLPQPNRLEGLRLSKDGRRLLIRYDSSFRMFDVPSLSPVGPVVSAAAHVVDAHFVDDARVLVALDEKGGVTFWEVRTGLPVAGTLDLRGLKTDSMMRMPEWLRPTRDGLTCLVGSRGKGWIIPVPRPIDGEPRRLSLWVQTITGMELDRDRFARSLDPATWHERRAELDAAGGPPRP